MKIQQIGHWVTCMKCGKNEVYVDKKVKKTICMNCMKK